MQAKRKNVALIETSSGNIDASLQKATLTRYAAKHNIEIDNIVGERAPAAGAAGAPEHGDLLNDIRQGGVGLLLILDDVRHAVPDEILSACRDADVKIKFVNALEERGLSQPGR
jgi:hypothetical protein